MCEVRLMVHLHGIECMQGHLTWVQKFHCVGHRPQTYKGGGTWLCHFCAAIKFVQVLPIRQVPADLKIPFNELTELALTSPSLAPIATFF